MCISMHKKYVWLISGFCWIKLIIHFAANAHYGLHADELYYIALSKHLQWGYPDNSPLIVFIARLSETVFGNGTFSYRIFPTVISATTLFITGLMTFHLGGKRLAIAITCTAMICSPVLLATGYFLQPIAFEQFFWTAGIFMLIRFVQTKKPVFLYGCATIMGLGILNKYTILIYGFAVFIAFIFTPGISRKLFLKHFLPAFLLCVLIVLPNFIWQFQNHFPAFHYFTYVKQRIIFKGAGDYLFQFTFFHGAGVAVWMAGLGYLLLNKAHKPYRFAAWAFMFCSAIILILQGKIYYGIGAFPVLFAAGGVCWEKMLTKAATFWRYNLFAMLILPVLIALPIVLPILPFELTIQYFKLMTAYTNITEPLRWEDGKTHQLSQFYADMLGWQELTRKTEKAATLMNTGQKKQAVVLTESYAIAGALSFYGQNRLPQIISPNNSFMLWSPQRLSATYVVYISRKKPEQIALLAKTFRLTGMLQNEYAHEKGTRIYLLYQPSKLLKNEYAAQRKQFLPN